MFGSSANTTSSKKPGRSDLGRQVRAASADGPVRAGNRCSAANGRGTELGLLGLFGFVVAFSGTVMAVGGLWSNVFVASSLAHALASEAVGLMAAAPPKALSAGFTLSYGLVAVGWFVFGLAALRVRVYPRAAAALLIVGAASRGSRSHRGGWPSAPPWPG